MEPVYLYSAGSRRHIAAGPINEYGWGTSLCGGSYETDDSRSDWEARFYDEPVAVRRHERRLAMPVCEHCLTRQENPRE